MASQLGAFDRHDILCTVRTVDSTALFRLNRTGKRVQASREVFRALPLADGLTATKHQTTHHSSLVRPFLHRLTLKLHIVFLLRTASKLVASQRDELPRGKTTTV